MLQTASAILVFLSSVTSDVSIRKHLEVVGSHMCSSLKRAVYQCTLKWCNWW